MKSKTEEIVKNLVGREDFFNRLNMIKGDGELEYLDELLKKTLKEITGSDDVDGNLDLSSSEVKEGEIRVEKKVNEFTANGWKFIDDGKGKLMAIPTSKAFKNTYDTCYGLFETKGLYHNGFKDQAIKDGACNQAGWFNGEKAVDITTFKYDLDKKIVDAMFKDNSAEKEVYLTEKNAIIQKKEAERLAKEAKFEEYRQEYIRKYKDLNYKSGDVPVRGSYTITATDYYYTLDGKTKTNIKHVKGDENSTAIDYSSAKGTPIVTTTEQTFKTDAQRWDGGNKNFNEITGKTGTGFGFKIVGHDKDHKYTYAHMNPDSQVAKDFQKLQDEAIKAGIDSFTLPIGVQIGEVGNTGNTLPLGKNSGFHLHYEIL